MRRRSNRLPKGEAGRLAALITNDFQRCDRPDRDLYQSADLSPQARARDVPVWPFVDGCYETRKLGPRQRPTVVCTQLAQPFAPRGTLRRLVTRGGYTGHEVVVTVSSDVCAWRSRWNEALRSVITHELTHAIDPNFMRAGYKRTTAGRTPAEFEAYVNTPVEIYARLQQVAHELSTAEHRRRSETRTRANLLHESETFNAIEAYLTPANRRKFLRLGAQLIATGRYPVTPLTGYVRRRRRGAAT